MTTITIAQLTTETLTGDGTFDVLMRANKAHLEAEYTKNRIKGAEYATVYLGSLDAILRTSMDFLLQKERVSLEADLLAQQILLAKVAVLKAEAELAIIEASLPKVAAEIAQINAQTLLIEAQTELAEQQKAMSIQQTANLTLEAVNIPKQGLILDAQKNKLIQDTANAVLEGTVLVAQECKLRAEFDLVMSNVTKSGSEITLLNQKVSTEKAQVQSLGVDDNSVIGRQKALYVAQTEGFNRDAEQKTAKIMVDTWNARRMTDEATVADGINMLNDPTVGRAVNKMLAGVGA